MSTDAWNDLPSITLVRSWNKLLQQNDGVSGENEEMDITVAQFDGEATQQEVQNWLAGPDEPCCQELSEDNILQQVN